MGAVGILGMSGGKPAEIRDDKIGAAKSRMQSRRGAAEGTIARLCYGAYYETSKTWTPFRQ